MNAPPSSQGKQLSLQELTAEAHRLYAVLVPQGPVQVIIPEHERGRLQQRYSEICALLTTAQGAQAEQKKQADKWAQEAQEALPELIPLLPQQWRGRIADISSMGPGAARDAALRTALNEVVNSDALAKLGPLGVVAGPMLRKFLRTGKL